MVMVMKHQVKHRGHRDETPAVSSWKDEPCVVTTYLFMKVRVSNTDTHHRERKKDITHHRERKKDIYAKGEKGRAREWATERATWRVTGRKRE